jgi:hypothetical protein
MLFYTFFNHLESLPVENRRTYFQEYCYKREKQYTRNNGEKASWQDLPVYVKKVEVVFTPQIIQRREAFSSRSRALMISGSSKRTPKQARRSRGDSTSDELKTKEHKLSEDGQAKQTAPRPAKLLEQQYAAMSMPRALNSDGQDPVEQPTSWLALHPPSPSAAPSC